MGVKPANLVPDPLHISAEAGVGLMCGGGGGRVGGGGAITLIRVLSWSYDHTNAM